MATQYLHTFQSASRSDHRLLSSRKGVSSNRWQPHLDLCYKVHVDASFNPDSELAGVGVIIRDHRGQVLLSVIKFLGFSPSADYVEGKTVIEGFYLAQDMGFHPIVVETDSQQVFGLLSAPIEDVSEVGALISRFRHSLSSRIRDLCRFTPRAGNEAAHRLARLALHRCSDFI